MEIKAISVVGKRKRGKTTFALSAPKPMTVFDFELGVERVEPKFVQNRDQIKVLPYVKEMLAVKERKPDNSINLWERLLNDFNDALQDESVRTIVFDTFSSVWEIRRASYLAELQKSEPHRKNLMPQEYSTPNADMKMLLTQCLLHDKILIVVHHTRDKYVNNAPTGEEEADGFKYTGDLVEAEFWMDKKKDETGQVKPVGRIETCRLAMSAEGLELNVPTYDLLTKLVAARRGEDSQ